MIGIVITTKINIRSERRIAPDTDMGDLFAGDVVIGTVIDGWLSFDRVFRKRGGIVAAELLGHTRYAATQEPSNPTIKHMMLVDANIMPPPVEPDPTPAQTAKPFSVTIDGEDYKSVTVEVEPK